MKTNIQSSAGFSFGRFAAYFRLYVMANKRKLLLAVSQILIITFILFIFGLYTGGTESYETIATMGGAQGIDPMWGSCNMIMVLISFVVAALAGSWMYSSVSAKHTRLMTFEIPAAQSEKFLTWWLIYVPGFFIAMFLCFYLADVLRVLWIMAGTDYGDYAHIIPIGSMLTFSYPSPTDSFSQNAAQTLLIVMSYGVLFNLNALFSLGNIFFHKLSFLKTSACLFVLMIVFSIITQIGFKVFFPGDNIELTQRISEDSAGAPWVFGTIFAIMGLFFYWLGYARYKETEIVNRW